MFKYVTRTNTIKLSEIKAKFHSFHPSEHRLVNVPNKNKVELRKLCIEENVGEQINVANYLKFSSGFFLGTIACMESIIFDSSKGENIAPLLYKNSVKQIKKGNFCISRNASIGKISFVNEDCNAIINGGISYFQFIEEYKFYVPAFFMVDFGTASLICTTSGGGTQQNVKRDTLLNFEVPLPTQRCSDKPEEIIEYVSLLVQNIVDKEIQIKRKEGEIATLIDRELLFNTIKDYKHSQPSIKEIIDNKSRLDTGTYNEKYKRVICEIKNYNNGYFGVHELGISWISGSTPEVSIQKEDGEYWWIAVADISYGLRYKEIKRYNINCTINNILENGDILITRKGATVGKLNMYFDENKMKAFVNEDLKVLRLSVTPIDKIFIALFLNSYHGQTQLLNKGSKGTKQGLTNVNIADTIIPRFEEAKKKEIAKKFYNPQKKETALTLGNYLNHEKKRNTELGIFQLNMEVLELKKKIEAVVDKIIKEEHIDISF